MKNNDEKEKVRVKGNMTEQDVGKYIQEKIQRAKRTGEKELVLISGDIQNELFLKDGLEEICTAMLNLMENGDVALKKPKSLRTTGLVVRYLL